MGHINFLGRGNRTGFMGSQGACGDRKGKLGEGRYGGMRECLERGEGVKRRDIWGWYGHLE